MVGLSNLVGKAVSQGDIGDFGGDVKGFTLAMMDLFPETLNGLTHIAYLNVAADVMVQDEGFLKEVMRYSYDNFMGIPLL